LNLGRYEVVRELGKGAMGLVYLAKDPLIGRLVALKTIRAVPTSDDEEAREYQQRFVREAQAAGNLSHPAIVTVHDIGQDEASGMSFIAMEYVDGPTLKEIIQQGRQLPYEELAEIVAQVAEALDFAHSKGIIHRDVKPANILLWGDSRAKITDFGIAKIATAVANLTTTGQFIGTPNYMAPEQVKGAAIDGRSDLFSLGIVLYESLTRRKPFGGDSLTTISYKIVHDVYPSLREVDPTIPGGFEAVVAKCLAKDPADRYQRGRDLAQALRGIFLPSSTQAVKHDRALTENTMVSLDKERMSTMEIPFPEANDPIPASEGPLDPTPRAARPVPVVQRKPIDWRRLATTTFQSKIPDLLFWGVILAALLGVSAYGASIWRQRVETPEVDVGREKLVAKQKQLRLEGAEMIRAGNVEGACRKYRALQELAPQSPFVAGVVNKLEQIRTQQVVSQQRTIDATTRFEEGRALYEKKDYAGALTAFEEAFYLNPNNKQAVEYMRLTREQLSAQQPKRELLQPLDAPVSSGRNTTTRKGSSVTRAAQQANTAPSALMTNVTGNAADGYVEVKIGGELLLHENLWDERKGVIRRRVPRPVQSYKEIRPLSLEVEVLVVVPNAKINERRVYRHTFKSRIVHQLTINVDTARRAVTFDLR
jgi:serine/threonine protein kinase